MDFPKDQNKLQNPLFKHRNEDRNEERTQLGRILTWVTNSSRFLLLESPTMASQAFLPLLSLLKSSLELSHIGRNNRKSCLSCLYMIYGLKTTSPPQISNSRTLKKIQKICKGERLRNDEGGTYMSRPKFQGFFFFSKALMEIHHELSLPFSLYSTLKLQNVSKRWTWTF